jgi:hypothetical protein
MDGRPKFLQLRIENGQRLRRTSHLKMEDCNGRIDETAHSFDRVEKDTQQAKLVLLVRWDSGSPTFIGDSVGHAALEHDH